MRKIITSTFVSLDGVMQGPGGPDEDRANGFPYGGWQIDFGDEDKLSDKIMKEFMADPFDLLLGRVTYDIWKAFWPQHKDVPIWGEKFDKAIKYVVSHEQIELPWNKSELISGDVAAKIEKLKQSDGPNLQVWGSGNLIQTLLEHRLIDQMHIWTYPVTIGTGKKLFADGTLPQRFKPVDSKVTPTGVVYAVYEPSELLKKN